MAPVLSFPSADPVILREIPVIRKIIEDETWLESERRGCPVGDNDTVVQENVCRIVLQMGQQIRCAVLQGMPESLLP